MSNERKNPEDDRHVTDVYKAMASERAPDHLNQQVLRLAVREGRTRYSRARAWIRPLAWAATIGLSFAFVLELSRLPSIEPDSVGIAVPNKNRVGVYDAKIKKSKASDARTNAAPSIPAADPATGAQRSEPKTPAVARPDRVSKPDRSSKNEFAPQGMAVLREAEDMARAQAGPDQAPTTMGAEIDDAPADRGSSERVLTEPFSATEVTAEDSAPDTFSAAATYAKAIEKKVLMSDPACPLEVRESAESWWACIETLRDNGQEDLADSEYGAFQQIFPDFVELGADR